MLSKTFYEELAAKGVKAGTLSLELATAPVYDLLTDKVIGTDIVTFKTVDVEVN